MDYLLKLQINELWCPELIWTEPSSIYCVYQCLRKSSIEIESYISKCIDNIMKICSIVGCAEKSIKLINCGRWISSLLIHLFHCKMIDKHISEVKTLQEPHE